MRPAILRRLRLALAMLAWLAQAVLPIAHAGLMNTAPKGAEQIWCGDPAMAPAAMAMLPPEVRAALADEGGVDTNPLVHCQLLCAAATTPPPLADVAPVEALRAAGLEPLFPVARSPLARPQAPPPPAQGPPAIS